jgi:hypothetical protein
MQWGRLIGASLLCGAILFVVGMVFHLLIPVVAPWIKMEYGNEALFRPWRGWTRIYMIAHPWVFALLFTAVFIGTRAVVGCANLGGWRDGLVYGLAVFLVGSLPVYSLNFASFQVSCGVVTCWLAQSICQYASAGVALGYCFGRAATA